MSKVILWVERERWSWNIEKNNHRKEEKTIFLQQGKGESRDKLVEGKKNRSTLKTWYRGKLSLFPLSQKNTGRKENFFT